MANKTFTDQSLLLLLVLKKYTVSNCFLILILSPPHQYNIVVLTILCIRKQTLPVYVNTRSLYITDNCPSAPFHLFQCYC